MNIAVMGETAAGENRVALIPSSVPKLQKLGCEISVVSGAELRLITKTKTTNKLELRFALTFNRP